MFRSLWYWILWNTGAADYRRHQCNETKPVGRNVWTCCQKHRYHLGPHDFKGKGKQPIRRV